MTTRREHITEINPEERLRGLAVSERLRDVPPEQVLTTFKPEERLHGLPPAVIENYLRKVRKKTRSPKRSKRG